MIQNRPKLLFICSQNKWRSLTAEKILESHPDFYVKSAGTENKARVKITAGMIGWADMIFVMERKHKARIQQRFAHEILDKKIHILNIPDDFQLMQPELIELLEIKLLPFGIMINFEE